MKSNTRMLETHEIWESDLLNEPAPPAQRAYAEHMGLRVPRGVTRRQLGQLIGEHIDHHEVGWGD